MNEKSNDSPLLIIFLLYLLPIISWVFYTYQTAPISFSFVVALIGALILFFGTSLFAALFRSQSETIREPAFQAEPMLKAPLAKPQEPVVLQDESPKFLNEIAELKTFVSHQQDALKEKEARLEKAAEENFDMKQKLQDVLEQAALQEEAARKKVEDLELETHQRQQAIQQLENQIHDLRYEIKTLLHLTEVDYSNIGLEPSRKEPAFQEFSIEEEQILEPVKTEEDARRLLKRCIDIAQKMTAGYRSSSLRSLSTDPYAFDLRRLSDALRIEKGALIVVYSPKEERILFASRDTKELLDYSSEKFSQEFSRIANEGFQFWNKAHEQLLTKSEVSVPALFKNRSEEEVPLESLLRTVPAGIFRSLIIGVFYRPSLQ